ncbi:MAG: radical SAM protein [Clostridiaceae bacterium]|nr:radical SAM protein [Clostridiaceae bacterium]RKJ80618.1 radical SAM protein [Butyricicoccus sp. 1XD8-22]
MAVQEIRCAAALNHVQSRFLPYSWDLNPYRGCAHGCRYCFALYSHGYMGDGSGDFYHDLYVKANIAERLEHDLSRRSWAGELINIGGVTDSYQPAEAEYRLMPEILRLMIKYRNPVIISTKSDLILRDFDLIARLSEVAAVNIAATITCADERVRERLEPGGVPSARRFEVLRAFADTRACTGVHLMPIIPFLNDSRASLSAVIAGARQARVDYLLPGMLNLRGRTREVFLRFLGEEFPQCSGPLRRLYRDQNAKKAYRNALMRWLRAETAAQGVSLDHLGPLRRLLAGDEQLSLF